MPPKTKGQKGQDKALEKQKQKIAEDKTFGLKNKNKSKSVQRYIKSVQASATSGPQKSEQLKKEEEFKAKEEKKRVTAQQSLLDSLYKGSENIKKLTVDPNAKKNDPRSIRADQKINVYVDQRDQMGASVDTCQGWSQEKLERIISSRHGGQNVQSDIVCKYFLDAVEKKNYGWFWVCPNGGDSCMYRHALPVGYVLASELEPEESEDDEDETLEEKIERQRAELPPGGKIVTLELFQEWKRKRIADKNVALQTEKASGKQTMTGRALFAFDESLFVDDDAADGDALLMGEEQEGEEDSSKEGESSADEHEEGETMDKQVDDDDDDDARTEHPIPASSSSSSNPPKDVAGAPGIRRAELFMDDCPDLDV